MEAGSIVRLRTFQTYSEDGDVRLGYTAPKGQVFVCLVLGYEPQPFHPIEPVSQFRHDRMLEKLGWFFGDPKDH